MTKVEEIARAMFATDWPNDKWERLGPGRATDRYHAIALAALKAMREPSEGMVKATDTIAVAFDDFALDDGMIYLDRRDAKQAWRAMVDAAIAEHGD